MSDTVHTKLTTIKTCPISGSHNKFTYLDLGSMPIANSLCDSKDDAINCELFPLSIDFYPASGISMLSRTICPEKIWSNYPYRSGINVPFFQHCQKMFTNICQFIKPKTSNLYIDIGGNDGTLLRAFKSINKNIQVLNIDPSVDPQLCLSHHPPIKSLQEFWTSECPNKIGTCKVITTTNVLQHHLDIQDFVLGITIALSTNGIWCLEFPYWKRCLETNQFDQIYHEHIYYFNLTPLYQLLNQHDLKIIHISEHAIHGGSLRLIISKKNSSFEEDNKIYNYLNQEKILNTEYYSQWGKTARNHMQYCQDFINSLKKSHSIAAFGAAAKGCTFLNTSGIGCNHLSYIADDTITKQGKFMPGVGTEICPRNRLITQPMDYVLILAHNFSDYIIDSLKKIDSKFITMFPNISIT